MTEQKQKAFSLSDLAVMIGCHRETLRRAIRDGKLKAAKIGKEWRVARCDVEDFYRAGGGGRLFDEVDSRENTLATISETK